MKLTAEEIYKKLLYEDKILELNGQIKFFLGNIKIIVKQRDVVGNIMQEWIEGWLKHHKVDFQINHNSQMPPDFYLDRSDLTKDLLEVKAFNYSATPGFDIADFNAYQSEIILKPYMLHAKYLIFGYQMQKNGCVIIKQMWLKNVWEICRMSKAWPINVQTKDGVVHKIRPGIWHSTKKTKFGTFASLEHFISAMEETVFRNPKTRSETSFWLANFKKSYEDRYQVSLDIPRWFEIENLYKQDKLIQTVELV